MTCNQTAVAVLQELCTKRKWNPPIYEVIDVTGSPNEPMFEVSVILSNGIKGVGRGRQKKAAKHDAAKKALTQLQERALPDVNIQPAQPKENVPPFRELIDHHQHVLYFYYPEVSNFCSDLSEDISGSNPVGELQLLCSAKHFPSPVYTLIGDVGEPHEKTFTYKCIVSERSATGQARKKQLAKHIAAFNMLKTLKSNLHAILAEIPNDPAVSSMYSQQAKEASQEKNRKDDAEVAKKYRVLRNVSDIPLPPIIDPGIKFTDYHHAYASQLSEYKNIKSRPDIKQEKNYVKKLELITQELHFTISKSVTTDDNGFGGKKCMVFLHLNTNPSTIQAGHDADEEKATQMAAKNVIEFLDVMSA